MERPWSNTIFLPNHSELSPSQLGFLDDNFRSSSSTKASHLVTNLNSICVELDSDLQSLQRQLEKLVLSWISRSFSAKTALLKLNLDLHNLSLQTSSSSSSSSSALYGAGSNNTQKISCDDLPHLIKQMQRIENVRVYAETTLKLEALVGDLEDAVFCVMNLRAKDIFSASFLSSSISTEQDLGPSQEKLLQAIKAMNEIEEALLSVSKNHPEWHCLMKSVDTRVDKTLAFLRPQVLADHRAVLASLGWPPETLTSKTESGKFLVLSNPLVLMQIDKRKSYSESFLSLCALQQLQSRRDKRKLNGSENEEISVGLWAIDELVSPIASRMEYHFSRWAHQPELMFSLVYKITRDFTFGVDDVLQPLIDRARLGSYSAKEAWVHAMVKMLSGFLVKRVFSVLAERYKERESRTEVISSWLHLIDLIITFDKRMQSLASTETHHHFSGSERLKGLGFSRGISVSSIFCDRPNWLKIWAKIELLDAWKKLKAELKDERAWVVDNNGNGFPIERENQEFLLYSREDHQAPVIAEFALRISWDFIERCQTLPSIMAKIQFIRSSTSEFLCHFFNVMVLRCKRTEFPEDDSLIRICTSINAARYCEFKLREWSDELTFLEMRIDENDLCDNGCFFAEEVKFLAELETNWVMEIVSDLLHQFETSSRTYVQTKGLFGQELKESQVGFTISVDLIEALDNLRTQLNVTKSSLNPLDFLDLWRSVADGIDYFMFCSILMSDTEFSDEGIKQFSTDTKALFVVFQPFCARPEAFFPCIRDSLKLLNLDKKEAKPLQVVLSEENRTKYSTSIGISHISFDQARKIVRNRRF